MSVTIGIDPHKSTHTAVAVGGGVSPITWCRSQRPSSG